MRRVATIVPVVAALLALAPVGWAQGCALCYTSLANGGPGVQRAFDMGILSLLIPTLFLFLGIGFLIYRRARAAGGPVRPFSALLRGAFPRAFPRSGSRASAPKGVVHGVGDAVKLSDSHLGI